MLRKKEKIPTTNSRNYNRAITTDTTDTSWIKKEHYEQIHANEKQTAQMKWINSLRDKSDQEEKDSKFKKQAVLEY